MKTAKAQWKICSRGHRFRGSGPCPVCWPGRMNRSGKYVALMRGINVGGKGIIKMADLRQAVEKSGYQDVKTYIQSGNVIFNAKGDTKTIVKKLETDLSKKFKLDLRVVVRSQTELKTIIDRAPIAWKRQDDIRKYLAFVRPPQTVEAVMQALQPKSGVDLMKPGAGVIYLSTLLSGLTKSGFSRLAGTPVYKDITIRNFTTVKKLAELMG